MFLAFIFPGGEEGSPTIQDVMIFLTGCDGVPPLGFGDVLPTIEFNSTGTLPTVSTCALTLYLPLNSPTDFEKFKEMMNLAVLGSQGFFGTV